MNNTYDQNKFIEHLSKEWGNNPCPMCKKDKGWGVADKVFELTEFSMEKTSFQGTVLPVVPVACNNCGYTVFVNAIHTGAIKAPE